MSTLDQSSSAVIGGPGDCYRYELRRCWDSRLPSLVVCMLNPSTADHTVNDPTILALIHFARSWDYGGIIVINLYAYRSPSPKAMMAAKERNGPENVAYIERALDYARAHGGRLLAAWGNDGDFEHRAAWFCSRARAHNVTLVCLGTTKDGHPKHPMARGKHRTPRDQQPIVWRGAAVQEAAE